MNFIDQAQFADVNGDGRGDLVFRGLDNRFWVSLSQGNRFDAAQLWMQHGGSYAIGQAQYADVDGDGRADLIFEGGCPPGGGTECFWVSRSSGAGFGAPESWVAHGGPYTLGRAQYADVDGDGKADLVYQGGCPGGSGTSCFWVSRSTGTGFTGPERWAEHGAGFYPPQ